MYRNRVTFRSGSAHVWAVCRAPQASIRTKQQLIKHILLWRSADNFTKSLNLLRYGVGGCGLDERSGVGVILLNKAVDLACQLSDCLKWITFQCPLPAQAKPTLDLIKPGTVSQYVVDMIPRMLR